jgi:2,4-dienoyl-CoA reductase (NADPH2)
MLKNIKEWIEALTGLFSTLSFSHEFIESITGILNNLRSSISVPDRYEILENQNILYSLGIDYFKASYHSQSNVVYLIGRFAFNGRVLLRNIFQKPLIDIEYNNPSKRYNNFKAF